MKMLIEYFLRLFAGERAHREGGKRRRGDNERRSQVTELVSHAAHIFTSPKLIFSFDVTSDDGQENNKNYHTCLSIVTINNRVYVCLRGGKSRNGDFCVLLLGRLSK